MPDASPSVRPVAIAVAPNGGRRTKADHPAMPLTAVELARAAAECAEAGASMIHVHVRDTGGRHVLDAAAYREATAAIRTAVGESMVVQITTEAMGVFQPAAQMAVVREVRPEAASLALRELAPDEEAEPEFARFLGWMRAEKITPQIILYTPDEVVRLDALARRGLVPFDEVPVLYVLGRYTPGQTSQPDDLLAFLEPGMPRFAHWSVCAFGSREAACVTAGALMGGHVRVGFENNLLMPDGSVASSNAALVGIVAGALADLGLATASADELRCAWSGG